MEDIGGIFDLHFHAVYINFGAITQQQHAWLAESDIAIQHNCAVGLVNTCRVTADLSVTLGYLNIAIQQSNIIGQGLGGIGIDQQ